MIDYLNYISAVYNSVYFYNTNSQKNIKLS